MRKLAALCGMSMLGLFAGPMPASAEESSPPPFVCNGTYTNKTIDNSVEVPANGVCVLNNSHVTQDVNAAGNAYFESNHTAVDGDIVGNSALTLYVRNHSVVMGNVLGYQTPQVFVYDSAIYDSVAGYNAVAPGYGHFQICGTTIGNSIGVSKVGPDILIGDPAGGCAGNTLTNGDLYVYQVSTAAELTVRSNTLKSGGLHALQNTGASQKFVQSNSLPNGQLECSGNQIPFVGAPNGAHASTKGGQCA